MKNKMIKSLSSGNKKAWITGEDNDVMIEILSRLPLKSLLKFRCVCKWWNHLISDPIFVLDYSRRNPQYQISGFYLQKFLYFEMYSELRFIPCSGQMDSAPKPSLSFIEDKNGVCIKHSCNGLLLCSSSRCLEEDRKYYICKPTTKQYMPLPKPDCKSVFGISIAFDPKNSPHHQVICICDYGLSVNRHQIKIYNSSTGTWRVSGNPFVVLDEFLFDRGVFWNGALHWVGKGESSLRFDVECELLLTTSMPSIPEGWNERRLGYFGESGGHLCLIEIYGPQTTIFDVMEMNGDYSGWFVKYHVNLGQLQTRFPLMVRANVQNIHRYIFSVLHLIHQQVGENEEELLLVVHIPGQIIRCNIRDNRLTGVYDISPDLKSMEENSNELSKDLGLWYTWESMLPFTNTLCYL